MSFKQAPAIIPGLYLIVFGSGFAWELYVRIFDRGNAEMAGLGTYLLTMPSSLLVEWVFGSMGFSIGHSDSSFVAVLGLSLLLNACLLYFVLETFRHGVKN